MSFEGILSIPTCDCKASGQVITLTSGSMENLSVPRQNVALVLNLRHLSQKHQFVPATEEPM